MNLMQAAVTIKELLSCDSELYAWTETYRRSNRCTVIGVLNLHLLQKKVV